MICIFHLNNCESSQEPIMHYLASYWHNMPTIYHFYTPYTTEYMCTCGYNRVVEENEDDSIERLYSLHLSHAPHTYECLHNDFLVTSDYNKLNNKWEDLCSQRGSTQIILEMQDTPRNAIVISTCS